MDHQVERAGPPPAVTPPDGELDLHRADAYGRSFADVYERWYDGVSDARATARFVAERCGTGPVVEVGVGSGRLAVPLTEAGCAVIGVDASAPMLDRCPRAPGLTLVRADMRALPLAGPIAGALIAFNTLFNLSSEAEQLGLLHQLRAMLANDGVLIVEALDLSALLSGPSDSIGVRTATDSGVVVSATQLDSRLQTVCGQHLEIDNQGISIRPWRLRWLTPSQLDAMAAGVALALLERFGGWTEEPFTDQSDTHVSVYGPIGSGA